MLLLILMIVQDGRHFSEGGYDRIAVKLFNEINVDCYYVRPLYYMSSSDLLATGELIDQ